MILISHRGNIDGPNKDRENSTQYIIEALTRGFDVEIDVWLKGDHFYLGHDAPIYWVDKGFLTNHKLWCHAKNLDALVAMVKNRNIHCFWHQNDDVTLTSKQYLWTYPGKEIAIEKAIAVVPELQIGWDISKAEGVCSDYVVKYLSET